MCDQEWSLGLNVVLDPAIFKTRIAIDRSTKMGFESDLFVSQIDENLICTIWYALLSYLSTECKDKQCSKWGS